MIKDLVAWSQDQYDHLPWRAERTAYRTLVSEIMLQQTTVATVLGKFESFMQQFPTIEHLARASEEEVTIAWRGLGYYRRARNLRRAAIDIVDRKNGEIPKSYEELVSIPGVGHYTAKAIMAMAYNEGAIALDANLERVLSRIYGLKIEKGPRLIAKLDELFARAEILSEMPQWGGRVINEALMDLGRVFCRKEKTNCAVCPMSDACTAYREKLIDQCPIYPQKKAKKHTLKLLRVLVREQGQVLVYKKPQSKWLAGQWELPTFILDCSDEKLDQYPRTSQKHWRVERTFSSTITKYKIENNVVEMNKQEFLKSFGTTEGLYFVEQNQHRENLAGVTVKILKSASH